MIQPRFCKLSTINIDKYFLRRRDKHLNENNSCLTGKQ